MSRYLNKTAAIILILLISIFVTSCSTGGIKFLEKTVQEGVELEGDKVGGLKESDVKERLINLSRNINVPPRDARLDERSWVVIERESPGRSVNIEKTLLNLLNSQKGDKVKLVIEEVSPMRTAEQLKNGIVEIASFSTPLIDKGTSRVNNIELASEKIDYRKLAPGDEFSFNSTVGKRTESKGYEEAPIIIKTEDGYKKGFGVGGGICQLATTLYNAAELGGMEITERHIHSKKVGYVPRGKDATVSYGGIDFKFKNSRTYPIMIRTYISKNSLTVKLFENRNI